MSVYRTIGPLDFIVIIFSVPGIIGQIGHCIGGNFNTYLGVVGWSICSSREIIEKSNSVILEYR